MMIRHLPVSALVDAFEYRHDAEREVNGFLMRGGLLRVRTGKVVLGSLTDRATSRAMVGFDGKVFYLHRVIFTVVNGAIPEDLQVDHKTGDYADNRVTNLRPATASQNQMNRKRSREGSACPYIGVVVRRKGVFGAFVSRSGKPILLGEYCDPVEAAKVRDAAVREYHGAYATLNSDLFEEVD